MNRISLAKMGHLLRSQQVSTQWLVPYSLDTSDVIGYLLNAPN